MDYLDRQQDRQDNRAAPTTQDEDYAYEMARQKRVDDELTKEIEQ